MSQTNKQSRKKSERIFKEEDGSWYVRVRGNYTLGPFSNHSDANQAIRHYIESRSPDFVSLNLPRWLHARFWLRIFGAADKNIPMGKRASHP
jgi:hypothetical protein